MLLRKGRFKKQGSFHARKFLLEFSRKIGVKDSVPVS